MHWLDEHKCLPGSSALVQQYWASSTIQQEADLCSFFGEHPRGKLQGT